MTIIPTDNRTLPNNSEMEWPQFLRQQDLFQILDEWPEATTESLLEIGCGDGFLSSLLADYFGSVVPTDITPRATFSGLIKADAQKLPFSDNSFDAIFSSNVLEHILDLDSCLKELHRVSTDKAIMVHTMPTAWWKSLQFITHPMHLSRALARKFWHKKPYLPSCVCSPSISEEPLQSAMMALKPSIHGISKTHLQEFQSFRSKWWESQFNSNGFTVLRKTHLYFHSPYRLFPYKFMRLRSFLARTYFPCVTAYWVGKTHC